MNPKISNIFIRNLFETNDICWELKNENVLVGKNGLGKSTILELVKASVTKDMNSRALQLCEGIQLTFDDQKSSKITNHLFNPVSFKNDLINRIKKEDFIKKVLDDINNKKIKINENKINEINHELVSKILNEIENEEYKKTLLDENHIELPVEYISTVNMSANSINRITTSDGKTANFLDYEIREELNKLLSSTNSNLNIKNLISVLNNMFHDSKKTVSIKNKKLIFQLDNNKIIDYESLSSGERQVIYIFTKVINANENNALILMDEPEISLHLSWQEMLLSEIRKVNKNSQIIIVTHSPAIVMNGWMDSFVDIKDIISEE